MTRMPRRCDLAAWAVLALAAVMALGDFAGAQGGPREPLATGTLTILSGGAAHRFSVEIARTPEQQQLGLMFRRKLAADAGMLFLYERPYRISMWMKNTLIPLDMIFIGVDGRIVDIAQRTVPHSVEPIYAGKPAIAVLEVNGGTAARLGLRIGDRVEHEAFGKAG